MIMSNTDQLYTITFLNRNTENSVIAVLFSFRRNCYLKKGTKKKSILSVLSNLKKGEPKPANPIGYSIEKVTCAMDVMEILIETETALHGMKNPEEICQYVMKQLCSFYQADYVGILEADLEIDNWFFKWWYRKGEDNVKQKDKRNLALPDEFAHAAPSWIKAYEQNKVISIQDVEQIKSIHPSEYALYNRLQATSVIGCPFYKHSTGFVVVKNPARYFRQTALLRILTYVLMMELNEYKMMRSIKLQARNQSIESEKDVHINLCGGINVISMDGNLDPSDFTPEEIELLTYMAFEVYGTSLPARELENRVWEKRFDSEGQKVRHAVSGIRKKKLHLFGNKLIANNNGRYCFNSELNVRIDVQEFLKLEALLAVLPTEDAVQKILEDMVAMYRGPIILTKDSPRWMVTNRHHMQNHYLKAVNRLLNIYFKKNDFTSLHEYAARSMRIIPNNVVGYYWKLRSYRKLGIIENEESLLENAKLCLPEDIYERLKSRIDRMDDENPDEIYEADYYI